MAWPGTLTEQEQTSLLAFVNAFRCFIGELARVNNHLDVMNTEYNGAQNNSDGHMSKISGADIIPNTGGLTGAEPITKDELLTLISYAQTALTVNTAAHRGNIAKACGELNLIG